MEKDPSRTLTKKLALGHDEPICFRSTFAASTTYCLKTMITHKGLSTKWSDEAEFTPVFKECVWKECPDYVDEYRKYSVDERNPRIATNIGNGWCTIIENTPLPLNQVTSWNAKIMKSKNNDGGNIYIGIAPSGINQNFDKIFEKCGWHFSCYNSTLFSGPPHYYRGKIYGPRESKGYYVHNEDSVGAVMDTTKGELSFVLDGVNPGVAFEGIPLDKPLVPCVNIAKKWDSVELLT